MATISGILYDVMDPDVAARTLHLLTLLQARPSWSAAELAERTGTSRRTLRRDLQRLAGLGYEVVSQPGPGGHYRLAAGTRMPPMVFDDHEVLALVVGLRMAEQTEVGEAAARALVKLRTVLPRPLASVAADVATHSETVVLDEVEGGKAVLGPLTEAAAADRQVAFSYTDQHGTTSSRRVDSLRFLFIRGRWAVLAFDEVRTDWRLFRLDRIRDLTTGGPAARREAPAEDLVTWLRTDFGRVPLPSAAPEPRSGSGDDVATTDFHGDSRQPGGLVGE